MGGLFGGKKKSAPAIPAPQAIPDIDRNVSTFAARRRRRGGFQDTILTGTNKTLKKKLA